MTDLICIKELMEKRKMVNHCIGRKESICCVECREEREHQAVMEYYRQDMPGEWAHCEVFPEKERCGGDS